MINLEKKYLLRPTVIHANIIKKNYETFCCGVCEENSIASEKLGSSQKVQPDSQGSIQKELDQNQRKKKIASLTKKNLFSSPQTALLACESMQERDAAILELEDLITGGKPAFGAHPNEASAKAFGPVRKKM
jgi:hypothetical protein